MLQFLDTNNVPLPKLQRLYGDATVPFRFECRDGYFLWATIPEGATAEILPDGETEWHDLATELDLAPFAPGMHDFELRVSNSEGTDDIVFTISEPDVEAPTAPVLSSATADSDSAITLVWTASTDDVGTTGYETRIDGGAWSDRGNVLTYQYTGLSAGTEYDFEVRAYDAWGNRSATSNLVSESTPDEDAPSAPVLTSANADSATEITLVWEAATDNVAVTGYETRIDGGSWTDRGNVLTYQYTGLTAATEYDFEVRAYDAAGNRSLASNLLSETTDAVPGHTFADADAEAFSDAVGTLDVTQQAAIDDLVIAIKAAALWTKLEAIYPFVGGTASAHKFNLKDPQDTDGAFRGTINGTITHNANGITGNGSTGYIDTHYNQSTNGAEDDEHVSVYCRTDANGGTVEIGCVDASGHGTRMFCWFDDTFKFFVKSQANTSFSPTVTARTGYFSLNRTASTGFRARHNASNSDLTQSSNVGPQNGNFTILAQNRVGSTVSGFSAKNLAWVALGQGLTEAEDEDLKDIVIAYQTALSRNV